MTASASSIRRLSALALLLWFAALPAMAAPAWLIATPDETAQASAPIQLDVVKPAAQGDWPETIRLSLARDDSTRDVTLAAVGPVAPGDARRAYRGVMPADLTGLVRAELGGAASNRQALLADAPDAIEQMRSAEAGAVTPAPQPESRDKLLFPANEPERSANEPMYFVIGGRTTASFQLSFKYRLFDPDSLPVEWLPPLAVLHLGYTPTSLWDLEADSVPFRDTGYRPSFFWQGARLGGGLIPDFLRGGKRG